jgi:hypothetical protein
LSHETIRPVNSLRFALYSFVNRRRTHRKQEGFNPNFFVSDLTLLHGLRTDRAQSKARLLQHARDFMSVNTFFSQEFDDHPLLVLHDIPVQRYFNFT